MTDPDTPQDRQRFSVPLKCPNCGAEGFARWEEAGGRRHGVERKLIVLDGGFHTEAGRTQSGDPMIVCDACDEIQPD
jgi:hypothetical protein